MSLNIMDNDLIMCECGVPLPMNIKYHILTDSHKSKSTLGHKMYHCECGSVIKWQNKSKHLDTKKHQNYINKQYYSSSDNEN